MSVHIWWFVYLNLMAVIMPRSGLENDKWFQWRRSRDVNKKERADKDREIRKRSKDEWGEPLRYIKPPVITPSHPREVQGTYVFIINQYQSSTITNRDPPETPQSPPEPPDPSKQPPNTSRNYPNAFKCIVHVLDKYYSRLNVVVVVVTVVVVVGTVIFGFVVISPVKLPISILRCAETHTGGL